MKNKKKQKKLKMKFLKLEKTIKLIYIKLTLKKLI